MKAILFLHPIPSSQKTYNSSLLDSNKVRCRLVLIMIDRILLQTFCNAFLSLETNIASLFFKFTLFFFLAFGLWSDVIICVEMCRCIHFL